MVIPDIDTLRGIIPTVAAKDFSRYEQPLLEAERWLTARVIGPGLLRSIQTEPADSHLQLLLRGAVAYKGYLLAIPQLDLVETDNGFAVVNDSTLVPASRERVQALMRSMSASLNDALELLCEALDNTPLHRTPWHSAPAYCFNIYLPTLNRFRQYGYFEGGILDYIAAFPTLRNITSNRIEPAISMEYSLYLLNFIANDETGLPFADYFMLAELRKSLAAYFNNDPQSGDASLGRVRQTLIENPDDFPVFKGSRLYRLICRPRADYSDSSIYPII